MAGYSSDRRTLLKIIGAIGATCAYPFPGDELLGQTTHEHPQPVSRSASRFFHDEDFRTISRIADLIIPETDSPGAISAGVPEYIDMVVARSVEQQALMSDGLRWLDSEAMRTAGVKFIALTEAQQLAVLQPLCAAADEHAGTTQQPRNVQFFALVKGLTADGYYTSKIGLMDELGYKGNMARDSFPACVPEH